MALQPVLSGLRPGLFLGGAGLPAGLPSQQKGTVLVQGLSQGQRRPDAGFGVYWLLFYLELMVLPMLFVLFGLFLWVQSKKEEDI